MNEKSNLDLLRTVAVTFVVAAHALTAKGIDHWGSFPILDIAPFGVYLFFVHTSLVLMWSLERRPNTLDFYIRRVFRLYPLAIIAILFAAVTHAPVAEIANGTFRAIPITAYTIVMNCLLMNGLIGHANLIHGVTWSLSPELFMYLMLPALFFYARETKRLWPLLVLWVLVALLARRAFPPEVGNVFGVLVPDFLSGIIAYVGFMRYRPRLPSWVLPPLLALLLYLFVALSGRIVFSDSPIRIDWFACLTLGLLLPHIKQFKARLPARLTHIVATYSYGIYLFHPFTVVLGMYVLAKHSLAVQLAALVLPLIVVTWLGYHFVEKPMIQLGARVAARLAGERGLPSPKTLETLEPAP